MVGGTVVVAFSGWEVGQWWVRVVAWVWAPVGF